MFRHWPVTSWHPSRLRLLHPEPFFPKHVETEWANGFNAGRPRRLLRGVHVNTWPRRVRGTCLLVGWVGRQVVNWTSGIVAGSFRTECFATWETPEMPLNDIECCQGAQMKSIWSYIMYEINVIRISKFISKKGPGQFYDCLNSWNFFFVFQAEVVAYLRWVLCSVTGPGGVGFGWLRCHAGNFLDFPGSTCEISTWSND